MTAPTFLPLDLRVPRCDHSSLTEVLKAGKSVALTLTRREGWVGGSILTFFAHVTQLMLPDHEAAGIPRRKSLPPPPSPQLKTGCMLDPEVAIPGGQLDVSLALEGEGFTGWTAIDLIYVFVYIKPQG